MIDPGRGDELPVWLPRKGDVCGDAGIPGSLLLGGQNPTATCVSPFPRLEEAGETSAM